MTSAEDAWFISEKAVWPPRQKPVPPFGVTLVEVIRSCPLRVCFDASQSQPYEQRLDPSARLGSAFHATIEELVIRLPRENLSPMEAAELAREQFHHALEFQAEKKEHNERERLLLFNQQRIDRALEAVMREARRISQESATNLTQQQGAISSNGQVATQSRPGRVAVEFPIESRDGLLKGKIDRVEWTTSGVHIVDYKSALRDDVPERYERQLQLYAWMWNENYGEYPAKATLAYPFVGTTHIVNIDPAACSLVVAETRTVIDRLMAAQSNGDLAQPGAVCQVCQYRPYCKAFWTRQNSESLLRQALEQAYFGFEGKIVSLDAQDEYWEMKIRWRDIMLTLSAPIERFPQLKRAKIGSQIRVLDTRLTGQYFSPKAVVSDTSELFIVER